MKSIFSITLLLFGSIALLHGADPPLLPRGNGFSIAAEEDGRDEIVYLELVEKEIYSGGSVVNQTHISIHRDASPYPEAPNATLKDGNWTLYWDTFRGYKPDLYTLRGGSYALPPRPKLATMLISHLTGNQKKYTSLSFYGSTSNWSTVLLDTLLKAKLKIGSLSITGFDAPFKLTEKQLINTVKTFKPTSFSLGTPFQLSVLSNKFFNLGLVRKFSYLGTTAVDKSEINDKALSKLKAVTLKLGRAPKLTLAGIRKFLMRVVNGKIAKGVVDFAMQNATFNLDGATLFKGVSGVKAVIDTENVDSTLWKVTKGSQVFYLQHYVDTYYPEKPETSLTLCKEAACNPMMFW